MVACLFRAGWFLWRSAVGSVRELLTAETNPGDAGATGNQAAWSDIDDSARWHGAARLTGFSS